MRATRSLSPRDVQVVAGVVAVTLTFAFALGIRSRRRRVAALSRATPLLRLQLGPAEWRRLLRMETRRSLEGLGINFAVWGVFAFGLWALLSSAGGLGSPDESWFASPWRAGLAAAAAAAVTTSLPMLVDRSFHRLRLRRGVVLVFPDCVVIEGRLVEWGSHLRELVDARVSPERDLLVFDVKVRSRGRSCTERILIPLPPDGAIARRAEAAARALVRG